MAGLRPPFDPGAIVLSGATDALVRLPDRYRDGAANPSRYEGAQLSLARFVPAGTDFALRWPADCAVRAIDLLPADAAALGVAQLLELSVLPFALAEVLRSLPGGAPTFYFGYAGPAYPAEDTLVRTSDPPVTLTGALFGVMFQDRATLSPRGWCGRLAGALLATRPADAALWSAWTALFASRPALRLLDAQGRPVAGQGIALGAVTRTSDASGDVAGLAFPAAGTLSLQPAPALPVLALLEANADTVPGQNGLVLPPDFAGGHVQLLDLADWYAPNLHDDPWGDAIGARYRLGSRMQPIVDGIPAFAALLDDLGRAKGAGGEALFAGWAFTDFDLRPGDDATSLFKLSSDIVAAGGDARVLIAQFLQASDASLDALSQEAGLVLLVLLGVGQPLALITTAATGYTNPLGLAAFAVIAGTAIALYAAELQHGSEVGDALRKVTEQTDPDFLAKLKTLDGPHFDARLSPHPAKLADNPVSASIPLPDGGTLADLQDKWGVFHQKIQLVRHADALASGDADRHVAYVGGIDANENRLDTPGHQGAGYRKPDAVADPAAAPFHDVHSRITGPAASEVFGVFAGRYRRDTAGDAAAAPPLAAPTATALNGTGRDVMQIAQTSFKPVPGSGSVPFDWAPEGNATTHGTIVGAIRAARELIYIEEQYMVPDDSYIAALVGAADHCQRCVIVLPSFLEIFFGDRRRGAMFERMQLAWGQRLLIGTPMRRPVLAPTGRVASTGRFALVADIGATDDTLFAAPLTRVAKPPFFLWIGGELMYATASTKVTAPGGAGPAAQLTVLRGGLGTDTRWCPNPRPHKAGEPITCAQPTGIFVHAKIMMVDDLFVSIGSTNVNRRGFFHDGEIHAFAIPQDLKGAADNPARDLRTRLWAEQLGLSPAMGAALLADPIAGFELFRRSSYQGNRFVPLDQLKVPTPLLGDLSIPGPDWVGNLLKFTIQNVLELESDDIFNTLSDPTSAIDPDPRPGPDLH